VTLKDGSGVPALLPVGGGRQITVSLDVELDPPLYGRLRSLAVRDPRLVTALGEGARVSLKVGWLFTNDLVTVSVGLLTFAIGDTAFPLTGSERPAWLGQLLKDIGGRFRRVSWTEAVEEVGGRLHDASLSVDPDRRSRFRSAVDALAEPPFLYGALELVRIGGRVEPCFGPGLMRSRQFGPSGAEALRLVEAVFLDAPDVLVIESGGSLQRDPAAVRSWLAERAQGEAATVEQIVLAAGGPAHGPGGIA
jgi:hypothetical protein